MEKLQESDIVRHILGMLQQHGNEVVQGDGYIYAIVEQAVSGQGFVHWTMSNGQGFLITISEPLNSQNTEEK